MTVEVRIVSMTYDDDWRTASSDSTDARTGTGADAELRMSGDGSVEIRNSNDPDGPIVTFAAKEWQEFLDGAKRGEFEIV